MGGGWCAGGRAKIRCEGSSASWIAPGVIAVCLFLQLFFLFLFLFLPSAQRGARVRGMARVGMNYFDIETAIDLWYTEFVAWDSFARHFR